MATDRLEQAICCMRHMAVVATAASRVTRVVRVGFEVIGHRRMTLDARVIGFHLSGKLVVRVAIVHGMAGKARHGTVLVARCLE